MNIKVIVTLLILNAVALTVKADLKYPICYEDVDSIEMRMVTFRYSQINAIDKHKFDSVYNICDSMIRAGAEEWKWHNAKKYVLKDKVEIVMFLAMLNHLKVCEETDEFKMPNAQVAEAFDYLITYAQIRLWTPIGKITAFTSPYLLELLDDTYYAGEVGEFIDKLSVYLTKFENKRKRIEKSMGK